MTSVALVRHAVEMLHLPSRVKGARGEPLPDGVVDLIAIAAGDEHLLAAAAAVAERPASVVRGAANFYIEQILMAPDADSYRILGASKSMTAAELRHHMTMLVKWLHPDLGIQHGREAFASRVNAAWDTLKTPERRAEYDARLAQAAGVGTKSDGSKSHKKKPHQAAHKPLSNGLKRIPNSRLAGQRKSGKLRRVLMSMFGIKS